MGEFLKNENLIKKFQLHIEEESNHRILFSGPYGIGKSSFLRNYFENNSKYNVVHLYPVNYSISTNEDIVDLLKYDVIYELISKNEIVLEEPISSIGKDVESFIQNKAPEIIIPLVEAIPHFGKPLIKLSKALASIELDYQKFKEELGKGEVEFLTSLYEKVEKNNGTPYQQDFYNDFIERKLEELKGSEEIQNVLIIDDLDRVDPEHIFRLFNVFSAHLELNRNTGINKFGFDKVIFVCDIENIQRIFEHKYGKGVDFTGYIDKFYSHEIFQFDNRTVLENWLKNQNIILEKYNDGYDCYFICSIIDSFIKTKVINFRNIESLRRNETAYKIFSFNSTQKTDKLSEDFSKCILPRHIAILSMICGDIGGLITKMELCKKNLSDQKASLNPWSDSSTIDYIERFILPVLHSRSHRFKSGPHTINYNEFTGFPIAPGQPGGIRYTLLQSSGSYITEIIDTNKNPYTFWHLLINSTKILHEQGIIS